MSWNEPGGNKKDPWSGRDQQDPPPDLEEVLRSLQERMGKLFGRGGGGGSYGGPGKLVGAVLLIVALLWGGSGFYIVDEGNRGVVTRFGRYVETTSSGLHWHWPAPVESKEIVNVEQQRFIEVGYRSGGRQQSSGSVPREALMLTQDENIVDIRLAVQYQIKDAQAYLFNVTDPDLTLKQVTESAQRSIIGKSTMDFVLTEGRSGIAEEIKSEIQQILDQYRAGIRVITVNFVDAQPPEEVQNAFEDAIKAREDEQRLKNEAEAYANEVVPTARGAAARMLEEAEAYKQKTIAKAQGDAGRFRELQAEYEKAPEVTRQRLYLDAMESIFEKTNTVMVDLKNGNNMLYLPLDKLATVPGRPPVAKEPEVIPPPVESPDSASRNARTGVRGREVRAP